MFNKKIILWGLLLLFITVSFSPINATEYEGYTINVNGFNFNMINGYEQDYESIINEDSTNLYGDPIHSYTVSFNGEDGSVTISIMTRYSEPFTQEDALDAGSNNQYMASTVENIGGKTGKLVEDRSLGHSEYSFWYVEDGVEIVIDSDSVDKIEYVISNAN